MTQKQARETLAQATAMLKLTREEHNVVAKALEVLRPSNEIKEAKEELQN